MDMHLQIAQNDRKRQFRPTSRKKLPGVTYHTVLAM